MPKPIPFDSLSLYAVLTECRVLIGGRLQEIRQPEPLTIVLHLYAHRQEHRLLISADPQFARMHLITRRLPNAPTPPPFCQSLRKHLEGATLRALYQVGFDRIVQMEFETREGVYRLIIELMGKHSNIFLVHGTGLIQSALKWVSPRQSQSRPIRSGEPYRLPPTRVEGLLNLLLMSDSEWHALWTRPQSEPERDWGAFIEGLSRFTAGELEQRAQAAGPEGLLEWAHAVREARWSPVLVREPSSGRALGAYPLPCSQLPREWQHPRTSVNLAWEQAFNERIERATAESLHATLQPALQRALQARERAIADLQNALQESQQADRYQLMGELILAFGHSLPPGSERLLAPDYTHPDMPLIEIPLDPAKSLAENAQRYFEKARRARQNRGGLQARLQTLLTERESIRHALEQLQSVSSDTGTLQSLLETARRNGWLREIPAERPSTRAEKDPFEGHKIGVYTSPDGYTILVGETADANDFLLTRVARPNDWWLHVRTGTGAHVIIRTDGRPERVPRRTLEYAAQLAAQHSADRHASIVEVDYTLRKYVRKPRNAPPGFALYTHEKTLAVRPSSS